MKRKKREAARKSAENRVWAAKQNRRMKKEQEANKQARIQAQIVSSNRRKSKLEAKLSLKTGERADDPFWIVINRKAPKLLDNTYIDAVRRLRKMTPRRRSISDWEPKGKGRNTQLISLAEHLLAEYPVPKFLWSALWEEDGDKLCPIVAGVAGGESFAKMCKSGAFPLPLTKKQCHAFMQSTADETFISAIRKVQVQTHGGDRNLHRAWLNQIGSRLKDSKDEVFWDSVLAWFCKQHMLDLNQLGPLVDYISHRYNEDEEFSMKGRTAAAMLRGMEEWHGELTRRRIYEENNYKPSGFKMGFYEVKKKLKTGHRYEAWRIEEILTSKELRAEGQAHKHCVASYGRSIATGSISIWSMSCNNEKQITIEVRNGSKKIVQARGKYNRQTTKDEFTIMQKWANNNGLNISLGFW